MYRLVSATFLAAFAFGSVSFADDTAPLKSELGAFAVTVDANGTEAFAPAVRVSPGDTIEYVVDITNASRDTLGGVLVLGPIPGGAVFSPDARNINVPARFEVQTAALGWSTYPPVVDIVSPNGERVEQTLPDSDIETVRWRLESELMPEAQVRARYRVTLTR